MHTLLRFLPLCALLFASCATKPPVAVPVARVLPVVQAAKSVADSADKASNAGRAADDQSTITANKVAAVKKESAQLKQSLDSAVTETKRLRQQKSATEQELVDLLNTLQQASTRNLFLEKEVEEAQHSVVQERELRRLANVALVDLQAAARAKDREVELLRNNLTIAVGDAEAQGAANRALAAQHDKAQTALGVATGRVKVWRGLFLTTAGLILVFVVFRYSFRLPI